MYIKGKDFEQILTRIVSEGNDTFLLLSEGSDVRIVSGVPKTRESLRFPGSFLFGGIFCTRGIEQRSGGFAAGSGFRRGGQTAGRGRISLRQLRRLRGGARAADAQLGGIPARGRPVSQLPAGGREGLHRPPRERLQMRRTLVGIRRRGKSTLVIQKIQKMHGYLLRTLAKRLEA